MKKTISVSFSKDLLTTIDELAVNHKSRSAFIEDVLRQEIAQMVRAKQDTRDIEIYAKHHAELNKEAEDVLSYQIIP
jgi:metal-responsive CopG/Arc/MetJ family transcriptional regulator